MANLVVVGLGTSEMIMSKWGAENPDFFPGKKNTSKIRWILQPAMLVLQEWHLY